jgi:hypothetical protein
MPYNKYNDFARVWISFNRHLEASLSEQSSLNFQIRARTMLTVQQSMLSIKNNLNLESYEF